MTYPSNATAAPRQVRLSEYTAVSLTELLGMAEEFFRTAGPDVHAQLCAYLGQQQPAVESGWFIDMLGFTTAHLQQCLEVGDQ